MREELRRPPRLRRTPPLTLPLRRRCVEEVGHNLPADRRVSLEQPLDDGVVACGHDQALSRT
jgi:hypothetical protein